MTSRSPSNARARAGWQTAAGMILCLFGLAACEAPLNLSAVEKNLQEPVRRSDQFQAAAAQGGMLVVVGNQGLILVSADEGSTWQRTKLPDWPALIGVAGCPDGTFAALAVEGQVWVSPDRGASWLPKSLDTEEIPQHIACAPDNRLWVVGSYSSIFWSENAGETWDNTSLDEDLIFTNIQFVDADTAYITGEFGAVLKSTDGGETWDRLDDLQDGFYPQAMYFADVDRGWVVGLQGQVLHTADGGLTWDAQHTGTRAPLFGIAPAGPDLYAVGGEGTVQRRQDGHWTSVDHGKPILLYLRVVLPVGSDRLLVAGQAGALYVLPLGELRAGGAGVSGGG